jgi:hypothetical protein
MCEVLLLPVTYVAAMYIWGERPARAVVEQHTAEQFVRPMFGGYVPAL